MIFSHITENTGEVTSIGLAVEYQQDPLPAYRHICAVSQYSLLLESAEIDSKNSLKSMMLIDAALRIECHGLTVTVTAISDNGAELLPYLADKLQGSAQVSSQHNSLHIQFSQPDRSRMLLPHHQSRMYLLCSVL